MTTWRFPPTAPHSALGLLPCSSCLPCRSPPYLGSPWWPWQLVWTWQEMPRQVRPSLVWLEQGILSLETMSWRLTWQTMTRRVMTWKVIPGLGMHRPAVPGLEASLPGRHSESRVKAIPQAASHCQPTQLSALLGQEIDALEQAARG